MSTVADAELVMSCLREDVSAFETLVHRYERAVYNIAFRLVSDREEARDITQTVFLKAYQGLRSYDTGRDFHSWLYRIAVNESINSRRGRKRTEPLSPAESERSAFGGNPEQSVENAERRRSIEEALMTLKPDYRAVIVLKHFMGLSYDEIARVVQVPEKTVKSRLFSARNLLKDNLMQRGVL